MFEMDKQRSVLLPFPENKPINIEFKDLTYTVSLGRRKGKKLILKGVSGKFRSGELTAIMGPSGAGKSSLLNILTGFQNKGMEGTITTGANRKVTGSGQYKKECCYILQDDRLAPLFTVQEAMNLAANLKLGTSISLKAKEFLIDDILDTLGLAMHKETRTERLSGGQKKRLSIALELIDNPPVMFLDEPTTGLDSSSSNQCIRMLKALSRGGRTIICTIHQPSATLYELFDHVYVLAEGQCVYQGASTNTVSYLTSVGLHCPEYHNPADYMLEVANGDYGNFTSQLCTTADENCWRNGPPITCLNEESELKLITDRKTEKSQSDPLQKAYVIVNSPSEMSRFITLMNRSVTQLYRDWTITHLKLFLHMFVGIFVGLKYLNMGNDGSQTFRNVGFLLVSVVYLSYTSMMPAVLRFPSELPVLKKERFNNWYCLKTYYLAFLVVDIPLQTLFSIVYASISYVMSSQPLELERFLQFLGVCIVLTLTAETTGILLGTLVSPVNGTFLGAIYTAFMLVLAGFLILLSHMPRVFVWVSQTSYLRHAIQALIAVVYGNNRETLPCPDDEIYCHYRSPQKLLQDMGMEDSNYWRSLGILISFFVILRTVAYFTLKRQLNHS